MNVIGYTRCSTQDQHESGLGLAAQEQRIREACEQRGWTLADLIREGASGKDLRREGLQDALSRLASGECEGLVVAKMDRLSRSLIDFAVLLDWFREAGVAFVALDFDLDTSTPTGELMASVLMAVAAWERRAIGERTKDALQTLRARGLPINQGGLVDRPELVRRVQALRMDGLSLRAICEILDTEGIPTTRGGARWRPSAIQAAVGRPRRSPRRAIPTLPRVTGRRD